MSKKSKEFQEFQEFLEWQQSRKDAQAPRPKTKARIPSGTGAPKRRNRPGGRPFGAGGLERAKRQGFIKD